MYVSFPAFAQSARVLSGTLNRPAAWNSSVTSEGLSHLTRSEVSKVPVPVVASGHPGVLSDSKLTKPYPYRQDLMWFTLDDGRMIRSWVHGAVCPERSGLTFRGRRADAWLIHG